MLMVMTRLTVAIPFILLFIMLKESNCAERIAIIMDATLDTSRYIGTSYPISFDITRYDNRDIVSISRFFGTDI